MSKKEVKTISRKNVYHRVHNTGQYDKHYTYIDGKMYDVYEYQGTYYLNDWKRRVDRFFGITDELFANPTRKVDYIHAGMFLLGTAILGAIVVPIAYLIHQATL